MTITRLPSGGPWQMDGCTMDLIGSVEGPTAGIAIAAARGRPAGRGGEPPCACATTLERVQAAWGLVYERYTQMGLIDVNPFAIHATRTAVGPHACVLWGPDGPDDADVGYTMTLVADGPEGLALDSVYAARLDALRRRGSGLLEMGMLADRRRSAARSIKVLVTMMRWATCYTLQRGLTDVVIGVHPRHAQFYARHYGFEEFAPPTSYALVRDHPVVGLRCRLVELLAQARLPRGLAEVRDRPVPARAFADRFAFAPQQLRGSAIAGFLEYRYGVHAPRMAVPRATTGVLRRPALAR